MTLATLINKACKGDPKAHRDLYDCTSSKLHSVALRYVVDHSLAADVLQESYIRIFKQLNKFEYRDDNSALAWMKRITATESLRLIKKRKRWLLNDSKGVTEETVSPDAFQSDHIMQALLQLSPKQRIVFNMFAIEGYNHKEIAQHLGIAESSSRALLTRARVQLQSIMTKIKTYEKVS